MGSDPFEEGVVAVKSGTPKSMNPHEENSEAYQQWESGYGSVPEVVDASSAVDGVGDELDLELP